MENIVKICHEMDVELSKFSNRDDVLSYCVAGKLNTLYMTQSEALDNVLSELDRCIDLEDMQHTSTVIRRLAKTLCCNRNQLWKLLEEVNNYGKI